MAASWFLSLPEQVTVSSGPDGEVVVTGRSTRIALRHLGPAVRAAVVRLAHPGATDGTLAESVLAAEGPLALARWSYHLHYLAQRGLLLVSVRAGDEPLATLVPIAPSFVIPSKSITSRPCLLSRFAYLHRHGDDLVLESPRSFGRIVLRDPRAAALVHVLARPARAEELAGRVPGLAADAAGSLLALLAGAGMVEEATADGITHEDTDPALRCWEFHDLLFHARSREGRHDAPIGAVYPFVGKLEPPPPLKPSTSAETIELYRPDLEKLQREDPPLARVQEERCSIREYGREPITARQLGEFLYRVARVRDCRDVAIETPHGPLTMAFTSRPYPAGGSLYEMEIYPLVNACTGLEPGLYHYDPLGHRLARVAGRTPAVEQLTRATGWAKETSPESLQVLLILAARFPRVSWKYATLAYALMLKHVGVLYQTMYLAATVMGLAPCALGDGDSDLFARAAGLDYYAEGSVGEFLLGSRPESHGSRS
jgi:SagB-type dehydrogenase family enzyme